jgi:hypothetical protein
MVAEWLGDLRSLRDLKRSTIRSYSEAVRAFCHFATDPPKMVVRVRRNCHSISIRKIPAATTATTAIQATAACAA